MSCGDTITTDTTLDSDLVDCPTNRIVIGADNVTLDLNGHTIDGDGTVQDVWPVPSRGCGRQHPQSRRDHGEGRLDTPIRGRARATGVTVFDLLGLAMSRNGGFGGFGITVGAAERVLIRNCSVNRTTGDSAGLHLVTTSGGPGMKT